ncbi:MAG: ATP-binding cassette domain-containing protein [Gaiella sp.]|nr:ATP-binding cassette domain-containing protein [Gaiella sp.]
MTHSVVLDDIVVRYGKATAVEGASLDAVGGRITALVGPNGAGKSSLLLAAYGAVEASGRVIVDGEDIAELSSTRRARSGIAIVPQGRQTFPRLSVSENLQVMAETLHLSRADTRQEVERALDHFPVLRERSKQLAGLLSGGEQQMLAIARALMASPRVVLFDEMLTGLAPIIVDELLVAARELAERGIVVLVAEPSIGAIADQVDRGFILIRGQIGSVVEGGERLASAYEERISAIV